MFPGRKVTFLFDMQDTGLSNMVSIDVTCLCEGGVMEYNS